MACTVVEDLIVGNCDPDCSMIGCDPTAVFGCAAPFTCNATADPNQNIATPPTCVFVCASGTGSCPTYPAIPAPLPTRPAVPQDE